MTDVSAVWCNCAFRQRERERERGGGGGGEQERERRKSATPAGYYNHGPVRSMLNITDMSVKIPLKCTQSVRKRGRERSEQKRQR